MIATVPSVPETSDTWLKFNTLRMLKGALSAEPGLPNPEDISERQFEVVESQGLPRINFTAQVGDETISGFARIAKKANRPDGIIRITDGNNIISRFRCKDSTIGMTATRL